MKWKKVLASFLAITLLFGILPTTAFAADNKLTETIDKLTSIKASETYEIDQGVTVILKSRLIVMGTLTIHGTLDIQEGGSLNFSGTVNVDGKTGGTVTLSSSDFAQVSASGNGSLTFTVGAKSNRTIPKGYIEEGKELSDNEGGYYIVKEPNTAGDADFDYIWDVLTNLNAVFTEKYTGTTVYASAEAQLLTYMEQVPAPSKNDVNDVLTNATAHLPKIKDIDSYLTNAKNAVTQKAETYSSQYPEYAMSDEKEKSLTEAAEDALTESFTQNIEALYTKQYSDPVDESAVSTAKSSIDQAKATATNAVDNALRDNAYEYVSSVIDKATENPGVSSTLNLTNKQKETLKAELEKLKEGTFSPIQAVRTKAQVMDAQNRAIKTLNDKYGTNESLTIKELLKKHIGTIGQTTTLTGVEYALSQALAELEDKAGAYKEIEGAIKSALDKLTSYEEYAKDKADKKWSERIEALGDTAKKTDLDSLVKRVSQDAIKKATSKEELETAVEAVEKAIDLLIEKQLAKWEIQAYAEEKELAEDPVATSFDADIEIAATENAVDRAKQQAFDAIDAKEKENALQDIQDQAIKGLVKYASQVYNGYFKDVTLFVPDGDVTVDNYLQSLVSAHKDLKDILDKWKTNINGESNRVTIEDVYGPGARSAVNEQFIKEVREDACANLNEYALGKGKTYVTNQDDARKGLGVARSGDSVSKLLENLKSTIAAAGNPGNTTDSAGYAKDAVLKALNDAKDNLDSWQGVKLTIKKMVAPAEMADSIQAESVQETSEEKLYLLDCVVTCTAEDSYGDSQFSYWTIGQSSSKITSKTLNLKMTADNEVTAVYGTQKPVDPEPQKNSFEISSIVEEGDRYKVTTKRHFVSGDVLGHGILYTTKTSLTEGTVKSSLTIENCDTASSVNVNGCDVRNSYVDDDTEFGSTEFTITKGKNRGKPIRIMGYVVIRDRDGTHIEFTKEVVSQEQLSS